MGALSSKLRNSTDGGILWWCPGCDEAHRISSGGSSGPQWRWNQDVDKPTFTPSVLVRGIRQDMNAEDLAAYDAERKRIQDSSILNDPRFGTVCHVFITDGNIQFLGDCTHSLKNQTVPIPDWPRRPEEFYIQD
jgi:Family of unknown function (DUF6527)